MAENNNLKRVRDEEVEDSPEGKRIRADFLFEILDDESEPDKIHDLDSVMRSFEEEMIAIFPSTDAVTDEVSGTDPRQPDLGFLLEASDDELGLPPPGADGDLFDAGEGDVTPAEPAGFGKIWGFDDEFHLDFGIGSEERDNGGDEVGVIFDGGLFDFSDGMCGPGDFSDVTWQPEYLPAV